MAGRRQQQQQAGREAAAAASSSSGASQGAAGSQASASSSSSSSSGTLSSLETLPAPESLPPIAEEEEEGEAARPWGRLFALAPGFAHLDCLNNEYWFGRDLNCDYSFPKVNLLQPELYKQYSKKHFRIFRKSTVEGD